MRTRIITYASIVCLILVLAMQAYIVYDHFQSIQNALTREVNAIVSESHQMELNKRQAKNGHDQKYIPPPPKTNNDVHYTIQDSKVNNADMLDILNRVVDVEVSKRKPMVIRDVDSITQVILKQRNIESEFAIQVVNPKTGVVLKRSKPDFEMSRFAILSKLLPLDFEDKRALQLVLINPMRSIFSEMAYLLMGSLILSLICLYGLWFLFHTLAQQKQLLSVKNDFFGHTAHELKRPVAQLHMALEALSRPAVDENKLKKERYLAISKDATRDMSEKIGMIMTLSMAEEGVFRLNYSDFDLIELIESMREKFTVVTDKTVSIQFEGVPEQVMIHADRDHIRQTIANLIDNAIKYSNDTVIITISIKHIKNNLMLCVRDNGIGIAPEKISSVFEKYTRINSAPGSPSGFGIGLSYVKAVVEKHAGKIEVVSELSKGSEFRVYLPE